MTLGLSQKQFFVFSRNPTAQGYKPILSNQPDPLSSIILPLISLFHEAQFHNWIRVSDFIYRFFCSFNLSLSTEHFSFIPKSFLFWVQKIGGEALLQDQGCDNMLKSQAQWAVMHEYRTLVSQWQFVHPKSLMHWKWSHFACISV